MKAHSMGKVLVLTTVFLVLVLMPAASVKPANAQTSLSTVIILSDGAVSPSTAPIVQNGNTYTFTDNLNAAIKIQKSNIILDGAGHTLTGSFSDNSTDIWVVGTGPDPNASDYYTIGIDLTGEGVNGITVENLKVENFSIGMYIWTQNNTVTGNSMSGNIVGLLMSGSNDTITKNFLSDNIDGLFFGSNSASGETPPDMIVNKNSFVNNSVQISGCQCKTYNLTETPHFWDDGKTGNFWSDYNGTDANRDGIGDTAYVIDALNVDRYPLMQAPINPLVGLPQPDLTLMLLSVGVACAVLAAAAFLTVLFLRRGGRIHYSFMSKHR